MKVRSNRERRRERSCVLNTDRQKSELISALVGPRFDVGSYVCYAMLLS